MRTKKRCGGWDQGRQCQRKGLKRYKKQGEPLCERCYARAHRKNGDTSCMISWKRTDIREAKRRAKKAAEAAMEKP